MLGGTVGVVGALSGWFGGGSVPSDTFTRGLVGYWSLDEGFGSIVYDASGNGNHGTLYYMSTSTNAWVEGRDGAALQFDGTDDYVGISADSSLNSDAFSVSFWVKFNQLRTQGIIGKDDSGTRWRFFMRSGDNGIELDAMPGEIANIYTSVPSVGEWYHIVGTYDGDKMRIYINGSLSTTSPSYVGALNMVGAKYIGKYVNVGYNFSGLMDDIRIYDVAVPISQIKQQYYIGLNSLLANGSITSKEYKEKINNIAMSDN